MNEYTHEEEMKHAQAAVLKKNPNVLKKVIPQTEQQKLYNHLLYRGFSVQIIHQVLFQHK
ncbi:MAG: RecX family transcriptional regulator [Desulfobacteraceae bacterium]|jgi:SOS response regulatory protein OraA/RecX